MLDVRKPFSDRTNRPNHPAGVTAGGPGTTPGGPAPTSGADSPENLTPTGAPTPNPSCKSGKKKSKPQFRLAEAPEATEGAMVRRFTEFLKQQNRARRTDSTEIEKLIRQTANSCEDNVRSFMKKELAVKIKEDHDTRVLEHRTLLDEMLCGFSRNIEN